MWPQPVTLPQVLPCRVKGKGRCKGHLRPCLWKWLAKPRASEDPEEELGLGLLVLLVFSPPEFSFFADSHHRAELRHWFLWGGWGGWRLPRSPGKGTSILLPGPGWPGCQVGCEGPVGEGRGGGFPTVSALL